MPFRHQPKGLPFLFFTEMWERFGFYVVQGMLILYLTQSFGFSDDRSFTIQGVFTALAYITPMAGGWLADRVLGFKTAILIGGVLLVIGYALLALPWNAVFYPALAVIILGNALFKSNVSSLLGTLYKPGDAARDSGFTIFYMGINLGVLLAGFSSGAIKNHFGWHAGFGLASAGLIIGLCVFMIGIKSNKIQYTHKTFTRKKFFTPAWLFFYGVISIVIFSIWLQSELLGNWLLPVTGVFLLIYISWITYQQTPEHRKRLILLNFLIISSITFWMLFLQVFSSANLFIERLVNKNIAGLTIPTTAFYAIESIFIILLGPLLAWAWHTLAQRKKNPTPFVKLVFAIAFVGLGFIVLAVSTCFANNEHLVSAGWIIFAYLLITIGDLLLTPIQLSTVTILSPPHLTGMMMGMWFISVGFGGEFAGLLAKIASVPDTMTNAVNQLSIYRHAFFNYAYLAFAVAVVLFIAQWRLRKLLEDS